MLTTYTVATFVLIFIVHLFAHLSTWADLNASDDAQAHSQSVWDSMHCQLTQQGPRCSPSCKCVL